MFIIVLSLVKFGIMQTNLFQSPNANLLPYDGEVHYFSPLINAQHCQRLLQNLLQEISWQPDELIMFGKPIVTKRKMAWVADEGVTYRYSGRTKQPINWTPALQEIKQLIFDKTRQSFNSCLLNLYHNGEEGMGWHSDDEKELGMPNCIASFSLGAARSFCFKHKQTKKQISLLLEAGSLLLMRGYTQQHWQHALPKTAAIKHPRINLTFRTILNLSS
ncbi:MAG: hypothetical protein RLY16_2275 [Bacteroidota bacterium]